MDYSASMPDNEDPAIGSPWSTSPNTSPTATRTGLGTTGTGPPPHSPFGRDTTQSSNDGDIPQRPDTATTSADSEADTMLPPPAASSEAESTQAPSEQSQPPEQPRKPQGPQYRLQAKITGLERTGKKDPILRFDIHVCHSIILFPLLRLSDPLDKPPALPHHTV